MTSDHVEKPKYCLFIGCYYLIQLKKSVNGAMLRIIALSRNKLEMSITISHSKFPQKMLSYLNIKTVTKHFVNFTCIFHLKK